MKLEGSREIYRVAFEAAKTELIEINAEFEKLRVRKEQVERLVTVLKALFGEDPNTEAVSQAVTPEVTQPIATQAAEASAELQPVPSDPFQRRIDHVLGIGAGIRDVRKYTRQF
ncbi:hypothetical protein P8935_16405 [Telmatobacter sp. DSM 110680]|uniref:Transposase C of IS166 homeodomain-containing protein n=1 Tax=Telmatobacter sp. DSM 110680 TaxID=3036704 RepID=A0AAU7DFM8_9BACT